MYCTVRSSTDQYTPLADTLMHSPMAPRLGHTSSLSYARARDTKRPASTGRHPSFVATVCVCFPYFFLLLDDKHTRQTNTPDPNLVPALLRLHPCTQAIRPPWRCSHKPQASWAQPARLRRKQSLLLRPLPVVVPATSSARSYRSYRAPTSATRASWPPSMRGRRRLRLKRVSVRGVSNACSEDTCTRETS